MNVTNIILSGLMDELLRAQKMASLERLTINIRHDLNNILGAIEGRSALLLGALPAANPVRQDIREIKSSCDNAVILTRTLLGYTKKRAAKATAMKLNDLILSAEPIIKKLAGTLVSLHISLDKDLRYIDADPGHMEQILINLVNNAIDASSEGCALKITTQNAGKGKKKGVELIVEDTGHGMDDRTARHMFEAFFTTREGAAGLGLYVVETLIRRYGGEISVKSLPGTGTTVGIFLPEAEKKSSG